MAFPCEVHESLKMTYTSSAFLRPPISLIAYLNIFSTYPYSSHMFDKGSKKRLYSSTSFIFWKDNHCCQEMLENKRSKGRPPASAHSSRRGQVESKKEQEGELTPFFTSGLEPSASLSASNHPRRYWQESQAPSWASSCTQKCLCCTRDPLR